MPHVAGVHDDELAVELVLACPVVLARQRHKGARVDPVRDDAYPLGRSALLLEPAAHRLADRHDAIGAAEVETDDPPQRQDHQRVLEPPERGGDLREDVLADDHERDTVASCDGDGDGAEHRRVGHAEDDVRAGGGEPLAERTGEKGDVVERPERETRALVGRRVDALDLHAVVHEAPRARLGVAQPARDHVDVVVARERLAELRQQVRGRLDSRPVVLVEDEQARARRRRAGLLHARRLTSAGCPIPTGRFASSSAHPRTGRQWHSAGRSGSRGS